ncbi:MAG: type II toxin-antitoxin system CcdA family antitoxin [Pseudomonadales bacterium]|nr:type II toxin-antitoxin system CcdA family antitoxin [Pseudomonadales bacterium]
MQTAYDTQAPKRATNLSINADLLSKAKELGINLSATLEQALVEVLRKRLRDQWMAENQAAIEAYNQHVDRQGVFSDGLRSF